MGGWVGGWGRGGDVCCDLEDEEGPISSMQGEEGSLAKAEKGREHVWALIPRRHYTKEGERQKVIVDSRRAATDMCGGTNDPATCFPGFFVPWGYFVIYCFRPPPPPS